MFMEDWTIRFASPFESSATDSFQFVVCRRVDGRIEHMKPDGMVETVDMGVQLKRDAIWTLPESVMSSLLNELWERGIRPSSPSLDTENDLLLKQIEDWKELLKSVLPRALRAEAKE